MKDRPNVRCAQCDSEIHWLEVFPNSLCLPCHARKHENDTPEEMLNDIIGGFWGRK
jgi:hypothetical protein